MTWYGMDLQRRKGGVYYLRRAVPEDIQGTLGKREVVRSLGTTELSEAKERAGRFGREIDREFDQVRFHSKAELSSEQARRIAEQHYRVWLAEDAACRASTNESRHSEVHDPDLLEKLAAEARYALASGTFAPVADLALEVLPGADLAADRKSRSFKRLAYWLLRYRIQFYARVDERNAGIWHDTEPAYLGGYVPRPLDFSE